MNRQLGILCASAWLAGCTATLSERDIARETGGAGLNVDKLVVVDCLLPGQVRRLGSAATYLSARRPIRTTAADCEVRGGEYVAFDRANYQTALQIWLPRAQENDLEAQTYVGEIYEKGLGTAPDYAEAARWYAKAANAGYGRAQMNLGFLYERGLGVPQDRTIALNWYRKASGIGEDALDYVSAISQSSAATVTALKAELSSQQQTTAALNAELERTRQALDQRQNQLQQQARQTQQQRRELEAARQALSAQQQRAAAPSASPADREKLAQQTQTLQTREAQLRLREQELAQLQAQSRQAEQRVQQLQQEKMTLALRADESLRDSRGENQQLRAKLSELQRELQTKQANLTTKEREMTVTRLELEEQRVEARQNTAAQTRVRQLEQQLSTREAEVRLQRQELAQLEAQVKQPRAQPLQLAALGPSIEVADPLLLSTRNATSLPVAQVNNAEPTRMVNGRIKAPAGLVAFSVNQQPVTVATNGVFQVPVPLQGAQTPVSLAVVDANGNRAVLDFTLVKASSTPAVRTRQAAPVPLALEALPDQTFGQYHALIIGNTRYQKLPALETPANDARALAQVLKERYQFETQVLLDADRAQILVALNALREKLGEQDSLLVYYAGHGTLEEQGEQGYWLPVDADPQTRANWISNKQITDILGTLASKHVLVVADSCYSGTMTRSSMFLPSSTMSQDQHSRWVTTLLQARSRTVLTSGGLKPVLDSGGDNNSVFAKAFLVALRENQGVLSGQQLYQVVAGRVADLAAARGFEQYPEYGPLRFAGHDCGEFFFRPKSRLAQRLHSDPLALNQPL